MLIIDEAWQKVPPAALKAAGWDGVIGYLDEDTTGKDITSDQVQALLSAGLEVGFVSEYNPAEFLGGAAAGNRRGEIAVARMRAIGAPPGTGIYAAGTDRDIETAADLATALQYALGYNALVEPAGYVPGIYGGYTLMNYLRSVGWQNLGRLLWQAAGWRGPGGAWAPGVNIRQTDADITVGQAQVDRDETETPFWGQWKGTNMAELDRNAHNADWGTNALLRLEDPAPGFIAMDGSQVSVPNVLAQELAEIKSMLQQLLNRPTVAGSFILSGTVTGSGRVSGAPTA